MDFKNIEEFVALCCDRSVEMLTKEIAEHEVITSSLRETLSTRIKEIQDSCLHPYFEEKRYGRLFLDTCAKCGFVKNTSTARS